MAKRNLRSEDVEGFVLAFHDEMTETQLRYNVRVRMDLRLGERRGHVSFHALALYEDDMGSERLAGSADAVWPSVKYTSIHAMLYNLACRLNVGVQHWYKDRTGEFYSSPTD